MFRNDIFANSRSDGFGVLEISPLDSNPEGPRRFVPLRRTELRGEVFGPLASLRLTQVFSYARDESAETLEALYRFPLPGDAAVTGITVRFGDTEIRAELAGREQAEASYERAKSEGRQAALATREAINVFTLRVAGLQPDQPVTVETRFVQLARPEKDGFSLRVPLTTAPRYVREDEVGATRATEAQPFALMRDPGHRFSLDLLVRGAEAPGSLTHALTSAPEGDAIVVRLADGEVIPDRDFVLTWKPARSSDRPTLQALAYDDPQSDWIYFLALAVPPASGAVRPPFPREVVLLVDHSGSMAGPKWEAADWAVRRFLEGLGDQDRFALGIFHSETSWQTPQPVAAEPQKRDEAIKFLLAQKEAGGTELGVALEQALGKKRADGTYSRHLLIVTDAEVTDEARILRLADAEARKQPRRRISVICIDAAPNSHFTLELAERGGGAAEFLTSEPEEDDITSALEDVLEDWAQPLQVGLKLEVNGSGLQAAGRSTGPGTKPGFEAIDLGDLPAGRSAWVVGRIPRGKERFLSLWLSAEGSGELATARIDLGEKGTGFPAIKPLFGARRINALEHLVHADYPPKELEDRLRRIGADLAEASQRPDDSLYPENSKAGAHTALKALLSRESLEFGLVSTETAFIATKAEAGHPVERTVIVANAYPAGWQIEAFGRASAGRGYGHSLRAKPAYLSMPPGPASANYAPPDSIDASMMDEGEDFMMAEYDEDSVFAPVAAAPIGIFDYKRGRGTIDIFDGIPDFRSGQAVLLDATDRVGPGTISLLTLRLPDGPADPDAIDPGLSLLIFVDDPAIPRAKVALADLIHGGGKRPLNLRVAPGRPVRIVLDDPAGAWAAKAPRLIVSLDVS